MTKYEVISTVLSGLAFILSVINFQRNKDISLANVELYINERITNTKEKVSDSIESMAALIAKKSSTQLSSEEETLLEIFKKNFNTAIENNLNSYEEACAKYLDNKIDKKRFKKTYHVEVRQLLENKELQSYFHPTTSRYTAILKVYNTWENFEK